MEQTNRPIDEGNRHLWLIRPALTSIRQGSFNWGAHREIDFGMCKVTEGLTITDPDWVHNWNSMWSLKPTHTLPRFAYHFFHASDDPVQAGRASGVHGQDARLAGRGQLRLRP